MKWLPNPYQLRTLLAVAKYHSFREAADEQHVTVSAISQQMLTLSRETKAVLYERKGNRIYLTQAGLELADFARQIVQLSEDAVTAMAGASTRRHLRVSMVTSIAEGLLPDVYRTFRRQQPETTIRIDIKPGAEIVDDLNGGCVDVALLPQYGENSNGIDRLFHEEFALDRLVAVVGKNDPLVSAGTTTISDLSQRHLFLESQSSPNCQRLIQRFQEQGTPPDIELFCSNSSLAIRMALAAGHVAVIPEIVALTSREESVTVPIVDGVSRSLRFCCPEYTLSDPVTTAFRHVVHDAFRQAKGRQ
jgi:DNA-binding transcriptional LysR family regulator